MFPKDLACRSSHALGGVLQPGTTPFSQSGVIQTDILTVPFRSEVPPAPPPGGSPARHESRGLEFRDSGLHVFLLCDFGQVTSLPRTPVSSSTK